MLVKIRQFIQQQQVVTAAQVQQHFQIEASALEPMLELLLQREDIVLVSPDRCQQECQTCDQPQYYQWKKAKT